MSNIEALFHPVKLLRTSGAFNTQVIVKHTANYCRHLGQFNMNVLWVNIDTLRLYVKHWNRCFNSEDEIRTGGTLNQTYNYMYTQKGKTFYLDIGCLHDLSWARTRPSAKHCELRGASPDSWLPKQRRHH